MKNYFVEIREQVANVAELSPAQYEEEFAAHPERFDTEWNGTLTLEDIEFIHDTDKWCGDHGPFTFTEAIHSITQGVAYFATRKYSISSMMGVEFGWHCDSPDGGLITIELMQMGGR
tara:strand:+ start:218 stop:568 length:351 start_codon:yes stop_codon:yes gene_type:complete